jgi:hypothetical protein
MPGYNTITGAGTPPPIDGSYDAELNLVDSPTPEPEAPDPDSLWWEPPNDGVDYPAPATAGAAAQPEPVSSPEYSGVAEPTDAGVPVEVSPPIESGLGKRVDDILNQSPTLRAMWEQAKAKDWRIQIREGEKRSEADQNAKPPTIYINPRDVKPGPDAHLKMAGLLAHEIGHAATSWPEPAAGKTRQEYVDKNTAINLQHEGAAAFANARARDEIHNSGGPETDISGRFDDQYDEIYQRCKAGLISEEDAKAQMAELMANERQVRNPDGSYVTKKEALQQHYGEQWDEKRRD